MFNLGNRKKDVLTIIAKGTRFEGKLQSDDGVFVEGSLITKYLKATTVQVAESGRLEVSDNVKCEYIEISGTVEGNINAREVKVNKNAYVRGSITYENIICNGGVINGKLIHFIGHPYNTY